MNIYTYICIYTDIKADLASLAGQGLRDVDALTIVLSTAGARALKVDFPQSRHFPPSETWPGPGGTQGPFRYAGAETKSTTVSSRDFCPFSRRPMESGQEQTDVTI